MTSKLLKTKGNVTYYMKILLQRQLPLPPYRLALNDIIWEAVQYENKNFPIVK